MIRICKDIKICLTRLGVSIDSIKMKVWNSLYPKSIRPKKIASILTAQVKCLIASIFYIGIFTSIFIALTSHATSSQTNPTSAKPSELCPLEHNTLNAVQPLPLPFNLDMKLLSQWALAHTPLSLTQPGSVATALVIHGLNNPPTVMDAYVSILNDLGFDVLKVALSGHRGDSKEQSLVTRQLWLQEVKTHLCLAWYQNKKRKVTIVAYSLGGLLTLDLILQNPKTQSLVNNIILIAPPIQVRWYTKLISIFRWLGPKFFLMSRNHKDYRSGSGTSMAAYVALEKSIKNVQTHNLATIKLPVLTVLHPKDELVDSQDTAASITQSNSQNWKIYWVNHRTPKSSTKYNNHLMLDAKTMGIIEWLRLKKDVQKFLFTTNHTK